MRMIREILRLKFEIGLSNRRISQSTGIARSTVSEYFARFERSDLSWPLPVELGDDVLECQLFPPPSASPVERPIPNWVDVHKELRRDGVTLYLLWQEYKVGQPDGVQYSQFCSLYRQWKGQVDPVMRQHHRPGEKLFVDYAGTTVSVTQRDTGEIREAQVFVATLGASNLVYLEATWTQTLVDWVMSHVRTFQFLGGCPAIIVPDNLKSGITRACYYDPDINPTYAAMASFFGVAVLPARKVKPRDKAKVENAVLIVERSVLARLRNQNFFSLAELNTCLHQLRDELNNRPFQKLPGSRQSTFDELERHRLKPLPTTPYRYTKWSKARVNIDYHIEVGGCYYSVPHRLVRLQVDVSVSNHIVEVFHRHQRVASHACRERKGDFSTVTEHMPPNHRAYAEWTPERLINWAEKSGPNTAQLVRTILISRPHIQQGFRACLGILRLSKDYGDTRLEAAAKRALALGSTRYKSIASILKNGLDQQPLPDNEDPVVDDPAAATHINIRGGDYYQQ